LFWYAKNFYLYPKTRVIFLQTIEPFLCSVLRLLITANVAHSLPILVTLTMETILSFETLVIARATGRNISEVGTILSSRSKNLKSYIKLTNWALQRRRNAFPVKYELDFYIPECDILHSRCDETVKSYNKYCV
jgi:hypothetical protein